MKALNCCKCDCVFYLPDALYESAKASSSIMFYCPYGHPQHFPDGPSKAEIEKKRADLAEQRLRQQQARVEDMERELDGVSRSRSAFKGQLTKVKKRVANGVCPCCNRIFEDLS